MAGASSFLAVPIEIRAHFSRVLLTPGSSNEYKACLISSAGKEYAY